VIFRESPGFLGEGLKSGSDEDKNSLAEENFFFKKSASLMVFDRGFFHECKANAEAGTGEPFMGNGSTEEFPPPGPKIKQEVLKYKKEERKTQAGRGARATRS